MMTPWGRTGGSQENVRDLGPLADMAKLAGGLPGARERCTQNIIKSVDYVGMAWTHNICNI